MTRLDEARAFEQAELHRGLDRELDLSAERPAVLGHEPPRGPGLLVAVIVVSSLSLAGVITLLRGDGSELSTRDPAEPSMGAEVLASDPREPTPTAAEAEVTPAVPPRPALATVVLPEPTPLPGASTRLEMNEKPGQATPAPRAGHPPRASRSSGRPSLAQQSSERSSHAPIEREHRLQLPAPIFDEPPPSESAELAESARPSAVEPALPDTEPRSLPGVDVPSLFEAPEPSESEPMPSAGVAPPVAPSPEPSTGVALPVVPPAVPPSEQDAPPPSGSVERPAAELPTSVEPRDPLAAGMAPSDRSPPPSAGP